MSATSNPLQFIATSNPLVENAKKTIEVMQEQKKVKVTETNVNDWQSVSWEN